MKTRFAALAILGLIAGSHPALAHHGPGISYDLVHPPITLKGTVTEFRWKNPHVSVFIDVKDANGKVVNWTAECGGVYFWSALGFRRDSLKPGDQITISVHPSRIGAPLGELAVLEMPNGKPVPKMGLNAPVQ